MPRKRRQTKTVAVQYPPIIKRKKIKRTPKPTSEELFEESIMTTPNHKKDDNDEKETKSAKTGEKRLFQTGADPTVKEELTKAEAKEKGFYWAD